MPAVVRHDLWKETGTVKTSSDFHLVLVWSENEGPNEKDAKLTHPSLLIEALAKEYGSRGAGKMRSSQIVESLDDLRPWLGIWRPETPVLYVKAAFKTDIATASWAASLSALEMNRRKGVALKAASAVAILPLANETNDLTAPGRIREELAGAFKSSGVKLLSLEEIDEKLRLNGYTDGGQLGSAIPRDLGGILRAEFLVMGNVEEFHQLPVEEVKAELKLIYAATGETVYAKTFHVVPRQEVSNAGSTAFKALDKAAGMLFKRAAGTVLKEECRSLTARFARAWPSFSSK